VERIDGRRARGERTRLKVLESLLALVDAGEFRPTAQQVAVHAGVALRTVYHHFEDVEALRTTALSLQIDRHRKVLEPIDPDLPLEERARLLARQCRRIFEAITPIRRAALFDENGTQDLPAGLVETLERRREQIAETFAPELAKRGSAQKDVLDGADAVSSWQTWYFLRSELGRSTAAAERIVQGALVDLFRPVR
jgi:TetR/AcrR family transcriptional regulator, regulator of autoinduction and epiphytic fitness